MEIEDQERKTKPQIPLSDRWEVVHLKRNGLTGPEVSQRLGIPVATCNSIFRKWKEEGIVENKKQPGRPRKVTEEEEKMLIETVERCPEMTLTELRGEINATFSNPTAFRILKENGFSNYTIPEKWTLDPEHKTLRLEWAKQYKEMPDSFWKSIVFTDECLIQNSPYKQKAWVSDKSSLPLIQRDRWQAKVLCWGAISYQGICILECLEGTINSDIYVDILKRRLLRNLPALSPQTKKGASMDRLIYQHDGAGIHTSFQVQSYFQSREITILPWPPRSPDLNLIEAVWSQLKYKLRRSYNNREELVKDIENCWKDISVEFIQNLYLSMNRRILAVIEAKGGPTDY